MCMRAAYIFEVGPGPRFRQGACGRNEQALYLRSVGSSILSNLQCGENSANVKNKQ